MSTNRSLSLAILVRVGDYFSLVIGKYFLAKIDVVLEALVPMESVAVSANFYIKFLIFMVSYSW